MPEMTRDDVMRETVHHTRRVAHLMLDVVERLQRRGVDHDESKFDAEEFDAFASETPGLRALTYGSDEYKAALERLGPALSRHYELNRHHPEHHEHGMEDMDLLDLIEMLADWKAATERHEDGDLVKSIVHNAHRFGYDEQMRGLLLTTAQRLGWLDEAPVTVEDAVLEGLTEFRDELTSENGEPAVSATTDLDRAYRCVFRGQPEGIGNESTETVVELVHIVGTAPRDLGLQGGVDVRRDDILIQHTGGMRNLAWVKPHTLFETSDQAKAAAEAAPQTAPETAGGAPA